MIKVGEHITLDFLGVKKKYPKSFFEKVIYKIAKAAKVEILNVSYVYRYWLLEIVILVFNF